MSFPSLNINNFLANSEFEMEEENDILELRLLGILVEAIPLPQPFIPSLRLRVLWYYNCIVEFDPPLGHKL